MFFGGGFASKETPLSIYSKNNFFEVSIPYSCFFPHQDQEEAYLSYLPTNIQKADLIKIKTYINTHFISDGDMEYRISFYLDPKGVHLKNISIQNLKQKNLTSSPITESTPTNFIKTIDINEKEKILILPNYNKAYLVMEKLPIYFINRVDVVINQIHQYQKEKNIFLQNPKYILILEKKSSLIQLLGVKIIEGDYEETFFILNTPKGGDFIIRTAENEILGKKVTGIFTGSPAIGALKNLGSPYGFRKDPINKKIIKYHAGQDIRVPMNTKILTVADGLVVDCGYNKGYGYFVVVHHGKSTKDGYSSLYAHLSEIKVQLRDKVKKGQIIGLSGSTGRSTGPHLHFEWITNIDGKRVNPVLIYYKKQTLPPFCPPLMDKVTQQVEQILLQYKEKEVLPF